jgi:Zn-dependent peptidase ImmA (M78 family)
MCETLLTLLNEAEKECIEVVSLPFKGNLKGLYYDKVIGLNKNLETTAEKCCVLAEELGHYYTSVGNILDQKQVQNRKQEHLARAWAFKKLVPLDKLIQAFNEGIRTRYELAEYLNVTEKFLCDAISYYKEKYGLYRRIGHYWICFEPLAILKSVDADNFFLSHQSNICFILEE